MSSYVSISRLEWIIKTIYSAICWLVFGLLQKRVYEYVPCSFPQVKDKRIAIVLSQISKCRSGCHHRTLGEHLSGRIRPSSELDTPHSNAICTLDATLNPDVLLGTRRIPAAVVSKGGWA